MNDFLEKQNEKVNNLLNEVWMEGYKKGIYRGMELERERIGKEEGEQDDT